MPGKWGLPGGVIEKNEIFEDTAIRETLEETQISLDKRDLKLLSLNEKVVVYLCPWYNREVVLDHEHTEWCWVKRADVTNYDTVPRIAELFDKALNYDDPR